MKRCQSLLLNIALFCLMWCGEAAFADSLGQQTKSNASSQSSSASSSSSSPKVDRISILQKQIELLKARTSQTTHELNELNSKRDLAISNIALERASKSLLDKAALDIAVQKSTLDSIAIEIIDSEQSIAWIQKNIQEVENQLNVMQVFGKTLSNATFLNRDELLQDLNFQKRLLALEKERAEWLHSLHQSVTSIWQYRKERLEQVKNRLQARRLIHMKERQGRDELRHQESQNAWLSRVKELYAKLETLDPGTMRPQYAALEREIYYANEEASFSYVQSLTARYKDQIHQMRALLLRNTTITLLNEMSQQLQVLNKQMSRLEKVLQTRHSVLDEHIQGLIARKKDDVVFQPYVKQLQGVLQQYKTANNNLTHLDLELRNFRKSLDKALQVELSARQGLPAFSLKMFLNLGKELLLLPAVSLQVLSGLLEHVLETVKRTSTAGLLFFALGEMLFIGCLGVVRYYLRRILNRLQERSLDIQRLCFHWVNQHFYELGLMGNMLLVCSFYEVPRHSYFFIIYLLLVWTLFKGVLTVFRHCLIENTIDTSGQDVKWYKQLKLLMIVGGLVTGFTVFVHELPLMYELTLLADRLFLAFLFMLSILLFRSGTFLLDMIWQRFETPHPYLHKIMHLLAVLVPVMLLVNSVVGLLGYMNLVFTLYWYQGIFVAVLMAYLILRGVLTDAFEQASQLSIHYLRNGWLWAEAFIKPIHRVLRVLLFMMAWVVLFLLYGWDKQSPIVGRLNSFLHSEIVNVLSTSITPLNTLEALLVASVFYWTAKWSREFVYRLLLTRTQDSGIRNSIAVLTQYCVVVVGLLIFLRVLGINFSALVAVAGLFAFGVGLGLRDLANNFACGFLILLERPLRVGDIVSVGGMEGEVTYIGGRAVTVRTSEHVELVVPNAEIFNKSFTNWTAKDNIVRSVVPIKVSRHDNPHEVKVIIQNVLSHQKEILKDPTYEVFLKEMSDTLMEFEVRYFVNIRQVKTRTAVMSTVLIAIWDAFSKYGIKTPHPQHEVLLKPAEHLLPVKIS